MHAEQATSSSAPVINFAETKRKRRPARKVATQSNHPDADLIESCMEYAAQVTISEVGYLIDPTDSKFAAFADDLAQSRARRALCRALNLSPVTIDGVRAKASLIKIILEDWNGDIDASEKEFLISVADDVKRFQRASRAEGKSAVAINEAAVR